MPADDPRGMALAGTVIFPREDLAVRLVRLRAPLDALARLRRCAQLEEQLHVAVSEFRDTAFARAGDNSGGANDRPSLARHTLVVPAAADVLVVVTDALHAQIVGLFLRAVDLDGFTAHEPRNADDARDALRAVFPRILERLLDAALPPTRWASFGRALDGPRLVRLPAGRPLLPVEPGDQRLLLALTLAAEPAVSWRPEGDAREHDVIFPSVIPSAQLIRPLGSIVDAMRRARVHPSRVDAFLADPDPSAAVQLCAAAAADDDVVHRHLAEPSDDDAGLLVVTAAPELDKEARVVSFARAPPVAYGHATLSDFIADFARRYNLPPDPSAFALDAADASGAVVAEIIFCDDDAHTRRLWPVRLLLARAGATEVPASMRDGDTDALLRELANDVADDEGEGEGGCLGLKLRFRRAGDADGDDTAVDHLCDRDVAAFAVDRGDPFRSAAIETPLRLPLAPPRDAPRLEMFAVEKAPKPSASTPTPPRPVGPPRKVVLASFKPARVRVPLAPVARNVAVVAPDEREREERGNEERGNDERGNEERGDGKEPRPSPIVPAEPLKRLSPEPSPPLEPSTEPETGAQTPAATLVSLEDPDAKTARAVHAGTETALAGTISATSGNGFVDAIVSPSAPRTPSFSPRPARVDVGSAVVSESVAALMMPPPPPVPRGPLPAAPPSKRPFVEGSTVTATATATKRPAKKRKAKEIDPEANEAAIRKRHKEEGDAILGKTPNDELVAFLKRSGMVGCANLKKDALVERAKEVLSREA